MKPKVYLAGGLNSNWRDKVKKLDGFIFFDPALHNLNEPEQYSSWDFHHIKISDIIFGYMEKDNTSGFGLSTEIGYSYGINKTIILVDEKSMYDKNFKKYFAIVRNCASVVFENFDDGIKYLKSYQLENKFAPFSVGDIVSMSIYGSSCDGAVVSKEDLFEVIDCNIINDEWCVSVKNLKNNTDSRFISAKHFQIYDKKI